MKIGVPFFPMLNQKWISDCKMEVKDYSFTYLSNGETCPLSMKPITIASQHEIPNFNLVDDRGEWDAVHFPATINRDMTIANPELLFGAQGLAVHNAELGLAVLLCSLSSNHRFAIPVVNFTVQNKSVSGSFSFKMPENFYRDKISLRTVVYVRSPGEPSGGEDILANLPGTILGVIDEIAVYLDGTGSLFPVKKESDPTHPLWRVECDWVDPFNDLFTEENVCVIFNQAHPNYGLLKIENGMNGSPFLADVIASALQIIIMKTIDSVGSVEALDNVDSACPGSILDAVHYFISTFGWDPHSPERLAETIRLDFDRRTGNDK